jgi:hypothetical protein
MAFFVVPPGTVAARNLSPRPVPWPMTALDCGLEQTLLASSSTSLIGR